jgi:hypothetical protein
MRRFSTSLPSNYQILIRSACRNSGVSVTITGAGFCQTTAVKFNGYPQLIVDSDIQITATLPAVQQCAITPSSGAVLLARRYLQ